MDVNLHVCFVNLHLCWYHFCVNLNIFAIFDIYYDLKCSKTIFYDI